MGMKKIERKWCLPILISLIGFGDQGPRVWHQPNELDSHLIKSLDKLFSREDDELIFQHDFAPAHMARKAKKFFEQRNIEVHE